jgi:hypothetical protein
VATGGCEMSKTIDIMSRLETAHRSYAELHAPMIIKNIMNLSFELQNLGGSVTNIIVSRNIYQLLVAYHNKMKNMCALEFNHDLYEKRQIICAGILIEQEK